MEQQVIRIGREGLEDRETLGQVVCTTCLIHGRHRAKVEWREILALQVDFRGGWPRSELVEVAVPSIQTACGPACGPRFGWGAGCDH